MSASAFADRITSLCGELDVAVTTQQIGDLDRYGQWLIDEAIPAGGLGPAEAPRVFDRHIADALMYIHGIPRGARTVVDVGSGVGLPGIPIAIVMPDIAMTILDRAERRTWLAKRAVRILSLDNALVVTGDAERPIPGLSEPFDAALFRASLPISQAAAAFRAMTTVGGVGLVGVSRLAERPDIPEPPPGVDFSLTAEESLVLDSPFWLLRMRAV
ncbi:MAG: 16S rRNA (guanine(527)-N(7))-methyltransferase RsmG [Acidimicrobiia bacterium]